MSVIKGAVEKIKCLFVVGKEKAKGIKNSEKRFSLEFILALVVITVLLLMTVSESVTLNERTIEVYDLESEIKNLNTELRSYEIMLDKKINLVEIDEYASYSLGMIKGDYTEVEGGNNRGSDTIESFEGNYESGGLLARILRAISDKFTSSWNNLLR